MRISQTSSTLAGRTVRVGGLVGDLVPGGFTLDDGTATGPVVLEGAAADLLPLIEPGDAINVVGRIESTDRGWTVVVADPAGIVLAGDPVAPGSSADTAGAGMRRAQRHGGRARRCTLGRHGARCRASIAGHRRPRDAARADGRVGRRDGPPATPSATPSDGPDGRPTGRVRRRDGVARRARSGSGGDRPGRPGRATHGHARSTHERPCLTLVRAQDYPRPSFAPAEQQIGARG